MSGKPENSKALSIYEVYLKKYQLKVVVIKKSSNF